jgi:hypothetical protein
MAAKENPHAGQGMVVLDIGGDVGALVVSAPYLVGCEIEICPAGRRGNAPDDGAGWWVGDWHSHHIHANGHSHGPAWPHVAVLERPQGDDWVPVAVFPGLHAGRYELWKRPDERTALTVEVLGGQVATVEWPSRPGRATA